MADADGEEAFTLKQLACEQLLSEEQHLKLEDVLLEEEFNSSRLVYVIKYTKIGEGLKFLPRKLANQTKHLQIWLEDLAGMGRHVRNKVVHEELRGPNGISHEIYTNIKEDNNIL